MDKKTVITVLLLLALVLLAGEVFAEAPKVTGTASAGVFSRYIFRGYELSKDSISVQPAVSISYAGFSAAFWGSIDGNETATQSFIPDRPGRKSFNETDLTLGYTYNIGKAGLTGGYIYYGTKYTSETEELFVTVSYDIITKPTLSVYRDITSYPGTYINLTLAHSLPVYKESTLDLSASAGYFVGEDEYFRTTDPASGAPGRKYSAFHDGMIKAGLTIPVARGISLQPTAQYWFPLSNDARKHGHNPNGHLDNTFVPGLTITYNF